MRFLKAGSLIKIKLGHEIRLTRAVRPGLDGLVHTQVDHKQPPMLLVKEHVHMSNQWAGKDKTEPRRAVRWYFLHGEKVWWVFRLLANGDAQDILGKIEVIHGN